MARLPCRPCTTSRRGVASIPFSEAISLDRLCSRAEVAADLVDLGNVIGKYLLDTPFHARLLFQMVQTMHQQIAHTLGELELQGQNWGGSVQSQHQSAIEFWRQALALQGDEALNAFVSAFAEEELARHQQAIALQISVRGIGRIWVANQSSTAQVYL